MRRSATLVAVALAVAGCGSGPTTPGGTVPPPPTGTYSLSGVVVGNQDGLPIRDATVTLTVFAVSHPATTDSAGQFSIGSLPDATFTLNISATGIVARQSMLRLTGTRTNTAIDVIRDAPPFVLAFYREFARNGHESTSLASIRPWTVAPSFYLRSVTADTGRSVSDGMLSAINRIIVNSVPELSGGHFGVVTFETGPDVRPPQDGWVNVSLVEDASVIGGAVGRSTIGGNTGNITVLYDPNACALCVPACGSLTEWSVDHEIVHAMGFYHTSRDGSEFHSGPGCPGSGRPEVTRYHAAVMYTRPPGNVDPDTDRSVFYLFGAQQPRQPVVTC